MNVSAVIPTQAKPGQGNMIQRLEGTSMLSQTFCPSLGLIPPTTHLRSLGLAYECNFDTIIHLGEEDAG